MRVESRSVRSIVGTASTANTGVTRALEDGDAAKTHHGDQVADTLGVLLRDSLLRLAVGVGDDLRKLSVGLLQKKVVVGQVWLVGVLVAIGDIEIGDERRLAAGQVLSDGQGVSNTDLDHVSRGKISYE